MDMRHLLAVAIILQLSAPVFADCANYTDSFSVRVLDGNLRPIQGAAVTVTFDRGASFGSQYFTTQPNYTDSSGTLHYTILNQGTSTRPIDCTITINATASGEKKGMQIQALSHGPTVDIAFDDIFPLFFYVRDQYKAPIADAGASVANITQRTDSNGLAKYFLRVGKYDYFASYKDAEEGGSLNVSNDTTYEVVFPYYKIRVETDDDFGQPVNATITIFNQTSQMQNGVFENDRTFGASVPYSLDYQGVVQSGYIYPATAPILSVNYDLHSPTFGQINSSMLNNRARLMIPVSDPGQYASGINVSSIETSYRLEPADAASPWTDAVTFTTGRNQFEADFPELPSNSIVDFKVQVKDNAGNRADIAGKFSTFAESNPQNNTQNQTNTQPPQGQEQGIPLIYIVGGVIAVILAVFVVFRLKSKGT
jgi:hypothetical protein